MIDLKMDENLCRHLVAFFVVVCSVSHGHVFFHEPSAILVKPDTINPDSDFGFALAHWNGSLIASSPNSDLNGEVFACPLSEIASNALNCSLLDMFHPRNYTRVLNPDQKFYLGGSITATTDYLFACAPLVTKDVRMSMDLTTHTDAVGSCFVYSSNGSAEYRGPESRFIRGEYGKERFEGGTGWTSLADEENGFLLVAKTSVNGDINYLRTDDPEGRPQSLSQQDMKRFKTDNLNIGYGITAGKFFSHETVYAISKQTAGNAGQIVFLEAVSTKNGSKKLKLVLSKKKLVIIDSKMVGGMFGYSLAAADLTLDGLSELLVGAPLQSEDKNEVEYGAVHIYLGGDKDSLNEGHRMRSIFGSKSLGRFGTTIAISDIDGDSIPEIFVSAPYEGSGVVYILSGHELKDTLFSTTSSLTIQVSKFIHSQRVVRSELPKFGFSLLTIPDIDGNGCDELAIGAPGSASAVLLKSIQTINVTVTSELVGLDVKEKDDNFTVKVCFDIGYSNKSNDISGHIIIRNDISGYARIIKNQNITIELSKKMEHKECQEIIVELLYHQKYDYILRTKVELENTKSLETKDFDASWVQLSTYSKTDTTLKVLRRCSGDDCQSDLSVEVEWNNTESLHGIETDTTKGQRWYKVESTESEMVTILVKNKGYEASEACVWVVIHGAPVSQLGRCSPQPPKNPIGYECVLPTYFRRGEQTPFHILLNMTRLSNADKGLVITARPHERCNQKVENASRDGYLNITYEFKEAWKKLRLDGVSRNLEITDVDILEASKKKDGNTTSDTEENVFKADQQYLIINDGTVTWVAAVMIEVEKRTFVKKVGTSERSCKPSETEHHHRVTCYLNLTPNNTMKLLVWSEMLRNDVGKHLNEGRPMNVTSHMRVTIESSKEPHIIQKSLVTEIRIKKDLGFKNKKWLIALVAALLALLLLALLTYFLCKRGFFQRKEKKKLAVLRESVRRHSMRISSERSNRRSKPSGGEDMTDIGIEVTEDSPFEEVPINSKDNTVLIDTQAQVHDEENKHGNKTGRKKTA